MDPLSQLLLFSACAIGGGCAGALLSGGWPQYEKWHAVIALTAVTAVCIIAIRNIH